MPLSNRVARIKNHTVMAYARLLHSRIESAEYEEGSVTLPRNTRSALTISPRTL